MVVLNPVGILFFYCFIYLKSVCLTADTDGTRSAPVSGASVTYIDIDLTKKQSTNQYEYKQVGVIDKFIAKDGFAIKSYSEGTDVKWTSDGTKYYREVKKLKQADGTFTYQTALFDPPNNAPKPEPKIVFEHNEKYMLFVMGTGTKCSEVVYDVNEVWKRDPNDIKNPYPLSVVFSVKGSTAFINFRHSTNIFRLVKNQWKCIYSGKVRPKSVNILFKERCEYCDCVETNKVFFYSAKGDVMFSRVRSYSGDVDEEVIWKAKDDLDFANMVVYNETLPNKLIVEVYHVNGLARMFKKEADGKWEECSLSHSPDTLTQDKVKFLGEKQTAETKSVLHSGSLAGEANVPIEEIPKETPGTSDQPELSLSSLSIPKVEVDSHSNQTRELPHLDLSKIEIFVSHQKFPTRPYEPHYSDYTLDTSNPNMVVYKMKNNVKCVQLNYNNKLIWHYETSKPEEHPRILYFLKYGPIILKLNDDLFHFSIISTEGNIDSVPMSKFDFKEIDVHLTAFDPGKNPIYLDRNSFETIERDVFVEYRFPSGTKCEAVKIKTKVPWAYVEEIYNAYPSVMYVFPSEIVVSCGDKSFIRHFDTTTPAGNYTPREISRLPLAGFEFEKCNGYLFYDIDPRVKCVGVNYDGKEVWKRDDSKPNSPYPFSVVFSSQGHTAFILFKETMNVLKLEGDKWTAVFSGREVVRELDVNEDESSVEFSYKQDGNVHTYIAEGNFLFSSVRKKRALSGRDKVIWYTEYAPELVNKVVFDKSNSKNLLLELHHVNGLVSTFIKTNSGGWHESLIEDSQIEVVKSNESIAEDSGPKNSSTVDSKTQNSKTVENEAQNSKSEKSGKDARVAPLSQHKVKILTEF